MIDGYNTVCHAVPTDDSESDIHSLIRMNEVWISNHVSSSQYMLQITKCDDRSCCSPFRSKLSTFMPTKFLPPPVALTYDPVLSVSEVTNPKTHFASLFQNLAIFDGNSISYDHFCPSVQSSISSRTCKVCKKYFGSITLLKDHLKLHKGNNSSKYEVPVAKKVLLVREDELLVRLQNDDLEWIPIEDVNFSEAEIMTFSSSETLPIFNVGECLTTLWESCDG